jgi:carbonic anhydrase
MKTPSRSSQHPQRPAMLARDHVPGVWSHQAWVLALGCLLCAGGWSASHAADQTESASHTAKPAAVAKASAPKATAPADAATDAAPIDLGNDIKKALRDRLIDRKKLTLVISDKPEPTPKASSPARSAPASSSHLKAEEIIMTEPAAPMAAPRAPAVAGRSAPVNHGRVVNPRASRDYIRAKAAALTGHEPAAPEPHGASHGDVHWSYSGKTGPQNWSELQPEFSTCATGQRQSPINIDDVYTLQGPAEALQFNYQPSNAVVVNNGHTIQVNLQGNNTLTVRGTTYTLVQFHFHTPSEEQVNYRNYAMVVHLVHRSADGQLAVVAVLMEPGVASPLINKVWTYMPLDVNDSVRTPTGLIDLNELLPKDQRYYQFMGSLTTPPCTEGVLWMVLKQPMQVSPAQLRLFQQLYPNNARPVQPLNNRPVRSAM